MPPRLMNHRILLMGVSVSKIYTNDSLSQNILHLLFIIIIVLKIVSFLFIKKGFFLSNASVYTRS